MSSNLIYALKENRLVHVDEVESGLKCDCYCPACRSQLIARKGSKMSHHFAHYNSEDCLLGYETSLHLAMKKIIEEFKVIKVPEIKVSFDSYKKPWTITESKELRVDKVLLEKKYGSIIPDVLLKIGNHELLVEVKVTHGIDNEKLCKIKDLEISAIEIDLSSKSSFSFDELAKIVKEDNEYKHWIYSVKANVIKSNVLKLAKSKDENVRGFARHVDYCPIRKRVYNGRPYANLIHDCLYCEYLLDAHELICIGDKRISTFTDYKEWIRNNKL